MFCVHARQFCSVPVVDIILSCARDTDTGEELYVLSLLHRHIAMHLSIDRSCSVFLDKSAHKTPLCATCQNVGTGFLCAFRSSNLVHLLVLSLDLHKGYNVLICTHSSGRFKENLTNLIMARNSKSFSMRRQTMSLLL